jgi:hypothetical protein
MRIPIFGEHLLRRAALEPDRRREWKFSRWFRSDDTAGFQSPKALVERQNAVWPRVKP